MTPELPATVAAAADTDWRQAVSRGATDRARSRSSLLRDPAQPSERAPRREAASAPFRVAAAPCRAELCRAGREPHPAEVAELLFEPIERLGTLAPRTREALYRSALLRVVREVTR